MNIKNLRVCSLKGRMTLSMLAIFLASMWVLSFYAITMLQRDMERISGEQQFSMVSVIAGDLNRDIEARLDALKTVARIVPPQMMGNKAELQRFLEARPVFQEMFNGGTSVTGLDGIATASFQFSVEGQGVSYLDRDYLVAALKDGSTTVSDPMLGINSKSAIVVMATPIFNAQGKIIGALKGVTNLAMPNFLDYVTNKGYGKTGDFLIIARKSDLILAATDKKRIMTRTGNSPAVARYAGSYEGNAVFVNTNGVEVLSSAKIIPAANWLLVASLPVAEAFEPIIDLRQLMFWATVALSLSAGGLTWWLLRRQLFPVLEAVEKLAVMANEKLPLHPLAVPEHAEVGELIKGVNRVLKTLELRESALVQSETLRGAIIDSVFAEIAVLNHHGVIIAVNQPWMRFAQENGLVHGNSTPSIGIGADYLEVCRASIFAGEGDFALQAFQGIKAVLDRRLPVFTLDYPCDGLNEVHWFRMVVTPLEPDHGGVVVAHNNISDKKYAEESRRLSEERLVMMQLGANDGFWDWDLIGKHLFYSAQWWKMIGYGNGELAADPELWRKLMHPDDVDRVDQFHSASLAGSTSSYAIEFRLQHKDGHYVPIESRGFIQRDHHGKAIRVSGSNLDLTERKRTETELLQAKAASDSANDAKSHFLATVSHDLRQPLAALTLYTDLLKVDELGSNKDVLPRIKDCVSALGEMLTDLLDVSKLDTAAIVPAPSLFEMAEVIDTLHSIHAAKAAQKGLSLRVHPTSLVVRTDRSLMLRIVGNLIVNALEYTHSGGVLIACRRRAGKQWLEVYDTGIGIADDKTDVIFDMFKQINNEARNSGSGLGLYIVAKTAELLGLQIRVRSRVGRGSLFAIELPFENKIIENKSKPFFLQKVKRRIAFVEDNVMVKRAMCLTLEQLGHEVMAASSGKEVIEDLRGLAPDVIISDYRLDHGETGNDVIKNIRTHFGEVIPALIITGDTDRDSVNIADDGIEVMYKPVSIDVLQASILRITDNTGMSVIG